MRPPFSSVFAGRAHGTARAVTLRAAEGHLAHGVVPTIAFPVHARLEVIGAKEPSTDIAARLPTLIGTGDRAARAPVLHGRYKRLHGPLAVDAWTSAARPPTLRENRSMTTARQTHPCRVRMHVMSVSQAASRVVGEN